MVGCDDDATFKPASEPVIACLGRQASTISARSAIGHKIKLINNFIAQGYGARLRRGVRAGGEVGHPAGRSTT
jgi:3-hydroxyisobutyrate dehydrogenase-like beta-hydroxyacid dehydrogenase